MNVYQKAFSTAWNLVDSFDEKHEKLSTVWQDSEISQVIKSVEGLDKITVPKILESHRKKIAEIVNLYYQKPESVDFIVMNVLKTRLHKIWSHVESEEPEDFYKKYDSKPLSFFTPDEFRKTYRGHGKKEELLTAEEREIFLYHALKFIGLDDAFQSYLHDVSNSARMGHIVLRHVDLLIEYKKEKIINEETMMNLISKVTECSVKYQQSHESTYDVDELYWKLHTVLRFLDTIYDYETKKKVWNNGYDLTKDEIYNTINCRLANCTIRVKLSNQEKDMIYSGELIEPKYCEFHQVFDEYGHCINAEKIKWFTKKLPETPVVLRMVGIEDDGFLEKNLHSRISSFVKENDDVAIVKECTEEFIYGHLDRDKKIKSIPRNIMYIRFNSDSSIKKFHETFSSAIGSGYYPEIMRTKL